MDNNDIKEKVEYDDKTMWFNYPKLLEKIKLGFDYDKIIEHTDFETNIFARDVLFRSHCNYKDILGLILEGNKFALNDLLCNIKTFLHNEFERNEFRLLTYEQLDIIQLNYDYINNIVNNN